MFHSSAADASDENDGGSLIGLRTLQLTIAMYKYSGIHSRLGHFHGRGLRAYDVNSCEFM